ncbi:MAG: hypothetical protein ACO3RV_08235, partial [Luteolibacter sp.]
MTHSFQNWVSKSRLARPNLPLRAYLGIGLILLFVGPPATAGTLYSTDFEAFPVGDNQWAGNGGWLSNDNSSGAHGILQDYVSNLPLGRTAYLGYEVPASSLTQVYR